MDGFQKDWWKQTFNTAYFDVWQHVYEESRTRAEVDFVMKSASLRDKKMLLDIACGQGRHSIEFAKRGLHVTGIDYSSDLLKIALNHALAEGVSINFKKADIRKFTLPKKFDCVTMLGNSFGYFEDEDNEKVIENISNVLKNNGIFILDLANTAGMLLHGNKGGVIKIPGGTIETKQTLFDPSSMMSYLEWKISTVEKVTKMFGRLRFYIFPEIKHILERNGLNVIGTAGSFAGEPYSIDTPRLIVVAKRKSRKS